MFETQCSELETYSYLIHIAPPFLNNSLILRFKGGYNDGLSFFGCDFEQPLECYLNSNNIDPFLLMISTNIETITKSLYSLVNNYTMHNYFS